MMTRDQIQTVLTALEGLNVPYGGRKQAIALLQAALAEPSEAVAWGILASNTGRMCQVELDPEEVAEHNQKYVVPLFTHPASKPEPLSMGAIVLYYIFGAE